MVEEHNMNVEKPDNALRKTLTRLGVALYRLKCAKLIIRLRSKPIRSLLYHIVDDQPNPFTDGLSVAVTPATFAANLDYFAAHYNVVSMRDIVENNLPPSPLLITFDDGYSSVHKHALPELQKRSLPAIVYLIGCALDGKLVWVNLLNYALNEHAKTTRDALSEFGDLAKLKRREDIISQIQHYYSPAEINAVCKKVCDSIDVPREHHLFCMANEIKAMQASGIEFGYHSRDHYNLSQCNEEELHAQIDNKHMDELLTSNTFAYPFGLFSAKATKIAKQNGYSRLMTVGNNNDLSSALHLDRTEVFTDDAATVFAQLEVVEPMIAWLRRILKSRKMANTEPEFEVERKAI